MVASSFRQGRLSCLGRNACRGRRIGVGCAAGSSARARSGSRTSSGAWSGTWSMHQTSGGGVRLAVDLGPVFEASSSPVHGHVEPYRPPPPPPHDQSPSTSRIVACMSTPCNGRSATPAPGESPILATPSTPPGGPPTGPLADQGAHSLPSHFAPRHATGPSQTIDRA